MPRDHHRWKNQEEARFGGEGGSVQLEGNRGGVRVCELERGSRVACRGIEGIYVPGVLGKNKGSVRDGYQDLL